MICKAARAGTAAGVKTSAAENSSNPPISSVFTPLPAAHLAARRCFTPAPFVAPLLSAVEIITRAAKLSPSFCCCCRCSLCSFK